MKHVGSHAEAFVFFVSFYDAMSPRSLPTLPLLLAVIAHTLLVSETALDRIMQLLPVCLDFLARLLQEC